MKIISAVILIRMDDDKTYQMLLEKGQDIGLLNLYSQLYGNIRIFETPIESIEISDKKEEP